MEGLLVFVEEQAVQTNEVVEEGFLEFLELDRVSELGVDSAHDFVAVAVVQAGVQVCVLFGDDLRWFVGPHHRQHEILFLATPLLLLFEQSEALERDRAFAEFLDP